jgi:16S rRNA (cytosine1407-C5)-methyltransferase
MALPDDKFHKKQLQLVERTAAALQISSNEAERLLSIPRSQSIRVNTLRSDTSSAKQALKALNVELQEVTWMPEGFFVTRNLEAARDSTSAQAAIYIQNAASWLPVLALDPQAGESILDVCAAPGGKTSHIAQLTQNRAFITANDNSRPRLLKLQRNLERLGAEGVNYTLHDATKLSQKLEIASFDKILLDAPCSGEGMMTLEDRKSFESWSVAHIKRLQQLQKKLIVQAWHLLKPGGTLVYSTCTMAPEENEAVIEYLLRHNDDAHIESLETLARDLPNRTQAVTSWNDRQYSPELAKSLRLIPSEYVEAFFVVRLRKEIA